MYCVKFPSSTNLSLHTACSNSSFVTRRLGFWTRKSRTSNALGESGTGDPERERVRRRESTTNGPKRYMVVRPPDAKVILSPPHRGVDLMWSPPAPPPHRHTPDKTGARGRAEPIGGNSPCVVPARRL